MGKCFMVPTKFDEFWKPLAPKFGGPDDGLLGVLTLGKIEAISALAASLSEESRDAVDAVRVPRL